jgi:FixJ family two-component response regulator
MTTPQSEVFLVDDDTSVRSALTRLLKSKGHKVVAFPSAQAFLESGAHLRPGCLLLDLHLPGIGGMELYERLRDEGAPMPVIFLTGHGDIPTSVRAMKAGAMDFLPKPVSKEALLVAVEVALKAESRLREERVATDEIHRRLVTLTAREHDVLRLVLTGLLNKQIADELGITEKTVKVHRGRVMAKMGVTAVAQLVWMAARVGLDRDPGTTGTSSPKRSA